LQYERRGQKEYVIYTLTDDGSVTFKFVDSAGTRTESYQSRTGGRGPGGRGVQRQPNSRPPRNENHETPPGRGGIDPLTRALDSNRDGLIDRTELERAKEVLKSLDRNGDGQLTPDELRGPGGGQGRGGQRGSGANPQDAGTSDPPPAQPAQGPRGPQPGDGPRQPWILVHAQEVDLNQDGIIGREEIVGEAERAFAGYDTDKDDKLSQGELDGNNVRSAMGGFLRGHAKELDRDHDGFLTSKEVVDNATRMFSRVDSDSDGRITKAELDASRR
jgi:Ca2+-binding EF-hand superfamily protein